MLVCCVMCVSVAVCCVSVVHNNRWLFGLHCSMEIDLLIGCWSTQISLLLISVCVCVYVCVHVNAHECMRMCL